MKKGLIFSIFLILITLFSGCASKNEYFQSRESFKIDQTNNYILVNDFINFVGDYYNPSTTKFVIDPKDDSSPFLAVMETRLREKGYGVSYAGMNSAAWLAWKINKTTDETIMVTYYIADSKFSKFYRVKNNKYIPYGTFTIFNKKQKIKYLSTENIQLPPAINELEVAIDNKQKKEEDVFSVYVKSNSYLHIREEPSTNSKILGTLKRGTKIKMAPIESKEKWGKLTSIDGCVALRYLKQSSNPECVEDSSNVSQ